MRSPPGRRHRGDRRRRSDAGLGHRPIAADLGGAATGTVRGWLRRLRAHAEPLRGYAMGEPHGAGGFVDLKLGHYSKDGIEVVDVEGEIGISTAPRLRGLLIDLAGKNSYQLVINLDKVGFLDSTGLGVLVGALNRVRAHDGSLDLVCTSRTSVPRCCARCVPLRASATGSARRGQRNWIKSFPGHGREGAPAAAGSARQAGRKQYLAGLSSLPAALGTTAVALLAGGMLVGRLTGRPLLRSGLRQLVRGGVAIAVPFTVGRLISGHVT